MTSERPKLALRTLNPQVSSSRSRKARLSSPPSPPKSAELEAQRAGLAAHLLAQHLLEQRRIGRRAVDAGDAELGDRLEELPGIADPERHDGGPARLDDHVVGDAAGPQLIVEAVHDADGPAARRR